MLRREPLSKARLEYFQCGMSTEVKDLNVSANTAKMKREYNLWCLTFQSGLLS